MENKRLTLKDTVTVKDLEKFGFDVGDQPKDKVGNLYGTKRFWNDNNWEDDCFISVEHNEVWLVQDGSCDSNERYFGNPQMFTVLEMYKAGMFKESK